MDVDNSEAARTDRGGFTRPIVYWSAVIVGVVVVVGAILLVRALSGPHTLSERLGDLILDEAHHSCLNGQASRKRVTAAERADLYPDLLPRARSAEMVSCEDLGAVSMVLHFKDRHDLLGAFQRSASARASGWCFVHASAFDGGFLDHPSSLRRFCLRLHGTLRPGPYRLSKTGS